MCFACTKRTLLGGRGGFLVSKMVIEGRVLRMGINRLSYFELSSLHFVVVGERLYRLMSFRV